MRLDGTIGHNAQMLFSLHIGAARGIRITTDTRDAVTDAGWETSAQISITGRRQRRIGISHDGRPCSAADPM